VRAPEAEGFTLIELVTTLVIISILAVVTAGIIVTLMQLFVYMPRDIKARMIAEEISDRILEGGPDARGLGYAVAINTAQADTLTYTVGYPAGADQYAVTFAYNIGTDKVYMQVGSGGSSVIPPDAAGDISVTCPSNVFFKYYKDDGSAWTAGGSDTYNIARVEMTYTVATGSGLFSQAQGSFSTTIGTDVRQYI